MSRAQTEFHYISNEMEDEGAKHMAAALRANSVRVHGAIQPADTQPPLQTLKVLQLHDGLIGAAGARELARALSRSSSLTTVHLCDNSIGVRRSLAVG